MSDEATETALDDAFDEGYDAYLNGKDTHDNPFPDCSSLAVAWEDGWAAADDDVYEID